MLVRLIALRFLFPPLSIHPTLSIKLLTSLILTLITVTNWRWPLPQKAFRLKSSARLNGDQRNRCYEGFRSNIHAKVIMAIKRINTSLHPNLARFTISCILNARSAMYTYKCSLTFSLVIAQTTPPKRCRGGKGYSYVFFVCVEIPVGEVSRSGDKGVPRAKRAEAQEAEEEVVSVHLHCESARADWRYTVGEMSKQLLRDSAE